MEKFVVHHGGPLQGRVKISGAKNAVLPIMAACLLTEESCTLENVPPLADVKNMGKLLEEFGAEVIFNEEKEIMKIHAKKIIDTESSYEIAGKLRASFLVAGALLGRNQNARLNLPGGCRIGSRPVDLHLKGFAKMGVKSKLEHGVIELNARMLKGSMIYLDFPSVGATENLMMAGVLAKGVTIIDNAAAEPEICDLADFLRSMGAKVIGDGTDKIVIKGVKELHGTTHRIIPDRIEAGTFMIGAAITGGDILLEDVCEEHLKPVIAKLSECNVKIERKEDGLRVYRKGKIQPTLLKTMPYPGFPTDMQAPFMSLLALAKGTSVITETIFENRFTHTDELQRMGAEIHLDSRSAVIEGVDELTGSKVKATDLRAGAALILSALAAKGETEIGDIHHIERGYYKLDEKLRGLGAEIERVQEPDEN